VAREGGVEPPTGGLDIRGGLNKHAAARGGLTGNLTDPDLADVVNAWPTLPPAIRAGIAAMVRIAMSESSTLPSA
jgi:hypothetical protein